MSFAGKTFHLEVAEENSEGECISCTRISHYLRLQITHLNPARPSELPLLLLVQSENSRGPLNVEVDNEQDFAHRWWHICLGRVQVSSSAQRHRFSSHVFVGQIIAFAFLVEVIHMQAAYQRDVCVLRASNIFFKCIMCGPLVRKHRTWGMQWQLHYC